MPRHLLSAGFFAALIAGFFAVGEAAAQSAQVSWGPWQFRWEVANDSGIGIRDLMFEGRKIL
jgi:hypothetical protein